MDVDLPVVHAQALEHTAKLVAGVPADRWPTPSVCGGWSVRELVNHLAAGNLWAGELVRGKTIAEVGDGLDGDVLGADPAVAFRHTATVAAEAFAAPGAMDAPCAVSYGPVPGSVYCGHRLLDVLVHGWDVAASTGQDTALPGDVVEACWAVLAPQLEMLQGTGAFGTAVDVPATADAQTRLLAVLGRRA
jgi:uncharacterized protein (TIGR03086 family)